jgi:hypothetical protein
MKRGSLRCAEWAWIASYAFAVHGSLFAVRLRQSFVLRLSLR